MSSAKTKNAQGFGPIQKKAVGPTTIDSSIVYVVDGKTVHFNAPSIAEVPVEEVSDPAVITEEMAEKEDIAIAESRIDEPTVSLEEAMAPAPEANEIVP